MMLQEPWIAELLTNPPAGSRVHASLTLPLTQAPGVSLPADFPAWLTTMLEAQGIARLTTMQWQALEHWRQGQALAVAAPTGGGRGVIRLLALYDTLARSQHGHALLLFPHKERELAQLARIMAWNAQLAPPYRLTAAIYDGETPLSARRTIKQAPPRLLLTTPEMLHAGILAYHGGWRAFFQELRAVVVVDAHTCGGALGAHVAHLVQRLRRIATHYGARPQYLLTTSPVANLQQVARSLLGEPCMTVSGDAYCSYPQSRILLEVDGPMEVIVDELVTRLQTANATPFVVPEHATPLSYFSRSTILATRSVIFPGLPTSLSHLQEYLAVLASQQAYSVGLLLLRGVTALERYLLRYPAVFHTLWQQHLALYPGNTLVAQRHLQCAAAELAVEAGEPYLQSYCLEQPPATTSPEPQPPHRRLSLRTYEPTWAVQSLPDGQLLTRLSAAQALRYGFSGALYRRDGQAFHVERVLPERRRLVVRPIRATYHTRGMVQTAITDLQMAAAACHEHWRITYGSLVYTETLHSYERLDIHTGERTSVHAVPEYQRALRTQGTWLGFPVMATPDILTAAHTVVHAVLAAIPLLLANSEVRLHGGVYPIPRENHDNDVEAVFIDEDAGGNGASAFLYSAYEQVLRAALQILLQCDCTQGCKRCLTALSCNSCGSTARLERQAGIGLLQHLLAEAAPAFASVTLPGVPVAPQHLYLCLTTQKSAEDVGGWQHRHLLGLGMAVTYNTRDRLYRVYSAETVTDLLDSLRQAELIIGFNPADFDYQVLQPYTTTPLTTLPTLAILSDVQQHLGFRVSLSHLVRETLGIERPDESIQTLSWFQQGRRERIVEYCRRDLDLIRALIRHGATQGNLWYSDHTEQRQSLPVHWQDIEPHG